VNRIERLKFAISDFNMMGFLGSDYTLEIRMGSNVYEYSSLCDSLDIEGSCLCSTSVKGYNAAAYGYVFIGKIESIFLREAGIHCEKIHEIRGDQEGRLLVYDVKEVVLEEENC